MTVRRILLGSFDLLHTGHIAQLLRLTGPDVHLTAAVLSDGAMVRIWGAPLMAAGDRVALVRRVRSVDRAGICGPENRWGLPEFDELYVDSSFAAGLTRCNPPWRDALHVVPTARVPQHPMVARALGPRVAVS